MFVYIHVPPNNPINARAPSSSPSMSNPIPSQKIGKSQKEKKKDKNKLQRSTKKAEASSWARRIIGVYSNCSDYFIFL